MAQSPSDFRSDTVTRASATMRQLMAEASVGDDVLDGDPTVQRLEQAAADWLGMEGALFVPSGTMANQVALGAWTRPGDEIIVQRFAHVTTFEAGAAGYLHGLQSMTVGGETGDFSLEQVRSCVRPTFIHCPPTSLICLEQTHNYAGGRVLPLQVFEEVSGFAREAKIPLHLDGARLANAAVASGVSARTYASHVDSVSLCFSKGLGAPVGSIIAGDGEFLERARLVRKRLGGWMRQSGHLAAAALHALENNVARLAEDHALARQLAERLGALPGLETEPDLVETNIVMVQVQHPGFDAKALSEALAQEGVLVMPMGERRLRFVTHLDVGPADLERLETAAHSLLS
ncbi:MAG: beta-eliminating lyase-related protein [Planctomycetota bacterium]|nr:beta-eliminating lyase-related protein [Planctomycetota bacterium]